MFSKNFKLLLLSFVLIYNTVFPDEFSEGPYGLNYFDIAECHKQIF